MSKLYDALIVGGGPAGLSSALVLARLHRTTAILAGPGYRSTGAEHSHSLISRDHVPAPEIRALGRKDLERYKATDITETTITSITRHEAGLRSYFIAKNDSNQEWKGRTVIMASGVRDILPDLPGYAENWPTSIYQCPVCDGHERSQGPVGTLCYPDINPALISHSITILHFLSQPVGTTIDTTLARAQKSNVTVFTNGKLDTTNPEHAKILDLCHAHKITVNNQPVVRLEPSPDQHTKPGLYVHLADGTRVFQNFLLHKPPTTPHSPALISQLGLETAQSPFGEYIKPNPPSNGTNVPGIFVAGDAATPMTTLTVALSSGAMAGVGAVQVLNELDDGIALERWREKGEGEGALR